MAPAILPAPPLIMNPPPPLTRIVASAIGAFTAVVGAALSVIAYVVLIFKEPLLTSLSTPLVVGGMGYLIASAFGIVGGLLALILDRYPRLTRLLLPVTFAALAGVLWGDWASGNSPHISKFFAEVISAASWAITAAVAVLVRDGWRWVTPSPSGEGAAERRVELSPERRGGRK